MRPISPGQDGSQIGPMRSGEMGGGGEVQATS